MADLPKYRTVMLCGQVNNVMPYGLSKEELKAIKNVKPDEDRDLISNASALASIYALNGLGYRLISTCRLSNSDLMWMLEKPLDDPPY